MVPQSEDSGSTANLLKKKKKKIKSVNLFQPPDQKFICVFFLCHQKAEFRTANGLIRTILSAVKKNVDKILTCDSEKHKKNILVGTRYLGAAEKKNT